MIEDYKVIADVTNSLLVDTGIEKVYYDLYMTLSECLEKIDIKIMFIKE